MKGKMNLSTIGWWVTIAGATYATLHAAVVGIINVSTVFKRVDDAHLRIDNHKKEVLDLIAKIDARIAEIQKEISEMYRLMVAKAGA